MHDKEIQYFSQGLNLAKNEFYLDSINKFKMFIDEYPQSDLADDALYNIGLCYFRMKQMEQAIDAFNQVIANYPDASISGLDKGNEFGKTAAKAYYSILNCYLFTRELKKAKTIVNHLKQYNNTTYVILDEKKVTFEELAEISIKKFNILIKK